MVRKSIMTMNRRMLLALSLLITASLLLASCSQGSKRGDGKNLPASTGQPYEVLLEGDTLGIVKEMLTEDVDILPQPEPMCDVISVKRGKVRGSYLLMRTRVVVDIDSCYKGYSFKVSHDENATPQTIIRIKAPSKYELQDQISARALRDTIYATEQRHLASVIKQNPEKQQLVRRLFGINIKIPAQLDASKEGRDFLWLSNNASRGMQNLIFIRVREPWDLAPPLKVERRQDFTSEYDSRFFEEMKGALDSTLRKNMVGETDDMYMQLSDFRRLNDKISQGLWEMKGDAMGGPYRLTRWSLANGKGTVFIIAFVYAPEMKKRNLMKQLEAVMSTAHRAADK